MPAQSPNLAVLVGNGLSIAFNSDLRLDVLTRDVIERIKKEYPAEGEEVAAAMRKIAARDPSGDPTRDFEVLIGAFGGQSRILEDLQGYADLAESDNHQLRESIDEVRAFAEKVRDHGISRVLELIAERSVAHEDESQELYDFVDEIVDTFTGRITFANLNYDTLLLSALLHRVGTGDMCDMGNANTGQWTYQREGHVYRVYPLRKSADQFPNRRVKLLHLHGSLTFWEAPGKGQFKFDTSLLRRFNLWEAIRAGDEEYRPLVVLANQYDKSGEVTEQPYKVAYEAFANSLDDADHWLIVGYSFRDECVNAVLQKAWARKAQPAKVLVVTLGDVPTRSQVETALGWSKFEGNSSTWLSFERRGADELAAPGGPWRRTFNAARKADAG